MPAVAAEPTTGRASVIDGDSIEISGERGRLLGAAALKELADLQNGGTYQCGRIERLGIWRRAWTELSRRRMKRLDKFAPSPDKRTELLCPVHPSGRFQT